MCPCTQVKNARWVRVFLNVSTCAASWSNGEPPGIWTHCRQLIVPSMFFNAHIFHNNLLQGLKMETFLHAAVSVDINCPLQAQWTTPQAFKFDIWLLHFSFLQELQKYNFGHFGKRWQLFQAYSTPAISASPLQLLDMFQLKPNPVSLPYKIILFS